MFDESPGCYDICDICGICFWEEDNVQLRSPDNQGGHNHPSPIEAQRNLDQTGTCEDRLLV